MKAVIVDGDISYPPTSGKRLRTLHLMLRLARRHQITYLCRGEANSAEARQAVEYLGDNGIETLVVDHPLARKSGPLFYARLAANVFSPLPYSVATHTSSAMRRAAGAYAARHPVDIWQLEWTAYLTALADVPDPRTVLVAHNVDTLIWQRYYETEPRRLKRWYIKQQWRKFARFERWAFSAATRVVAVSPDDAALIRDDFGMPHVDVVDNGIDREYFANVRGQRDPKCILFLGALDWRPNLDALGVLLDEIFPAVLAEEPAARLCIVGRQPPEALVRRVKTLPQVELHADVPDVRPFLAQSGVMTVPLRIGGGSRLKILEALACGLPVVSTAVGAEGLCLQAGQEYALADQPAEMARVLVQCLRTPEPFRDMAERGRRVVLEHYDWDVLADKLERVWERACTFGGSTCGARFQRARGGRHVGNVPHKISEDHVE